MGAPPRARGQRIHGSSPPLPAGGQTGTANAKGRHGRRRRNRGRRTTPMRDVAGHWTTTQPSRSVPMTPSSVPDEKGWCPKESDRHFPARYHLLGAHHRRHPVPVASPPRLGRARDEITRLHSATETSAFDLPTASTAEVRGRMFRPPRACCNHPSSPATDQVSAAVLVRLCHV